jgi:hypothetical protein
MTIDRITLKELVEMGSYADLLREMTAFITDGMMDIDVEGGLTGAAHGECSPAAKVQGCLCSGGRLRNKSADRRLLSVSEPVFRTQALPSRLWVTRHRTQPRKPAANAATQA